MGLEAAEWLTGIGTLTLAAVAVWQDPIRNYFRGPVLEVSLKTEPPDYIKVPENINRPPPMMSYPWTAPVEALYVRMVVENRGRAPALNVEVYASKLTRLRRDGEWEAVREFPPMNLTWSDVGGMYFARIAPGMGKHCDIASIYDPSALEAVLGGPLRKDLDAKQTCLSFLTIARPNHRGNIVGPGDYRVSLIIAAENAKPIKRTLTMTLPGAWYSDQTTMLRDGLGVNIDRI